GPTPAHARRIDGCARSLQHQRARMLSQQRGDARAREQRIDRRELTPRIAHGGGGGGGTGVRGARCVVSGGVGLGTLKLTSPEPFLPMRFVASTTRTTYL